MSWLRAILLYLSLAFIANASLAGTEEGLRNKVSLVGILFVGEFFGPPNYGELPTSDAIERCFFIQMPMSVEMQIHSNPIRTEGDRQVLESHFVQLVLLGQNLQKANGLIGRKIRVVGSLFRAETGHHRTPVLIQVDEVLPIQSWGR